MPANDISASHINEAITVLQDALRKEAFDQKAVHADIVKAANILLGMLGLKSVGPDPIRG